MEKIPVSVAVITLNEESNIKGCLESVTEFAEVVVVDSGSSVCAAPRTRVQH